MIFDPIPAPNRKVLREFGVFVGGLLAILIGVVFPLLQGHPVIIWPLLAGVVSGLIGLIAPGILRPIYYLWMRFSQALAWVNNTIVLSLVFYGVVTPMGIVMRSLLNYDPMNMHKNTDPSFRKPSTHRSPHSLEKPF